MPEIHQLLDVILEQLVKLGAPVAQVLQPGLAPEVIARVFESRGLVPSRELELLYQWRNGAPIGEDLHFYPWWYFLSLDEAAKSHDALKRWEDARLWPAFTDLGGDFVCTVCGAEHTDTSPVYECISEEGAPSLAYGSLGAMLRAILAYLEGGAFLYTDDGIEIDDARHEKITRRLGPDAM